MESDAKIQAFLLLGKNLKGRSIADLIVKATAEPGLFNFGEFWDLPAVQELKTSEFASHAALLELFCYGSWSDYKAHASSLPPLNAGQQHKLKQLTLAQLASKQRVLEYPTIMQQLDIPQDIRQLEDFIITECFYTGLIQGKLDQKLGCLMVHDVISRDVQQEQVPQLSAALSTWLATAQGVMCELEQQVEWQARAAEAAAAKKETLDKAVEEAKRNLKTELEQRAADTGGWMMDGEPGQWGPGDLDDEPVARERKPSGMMRPKRRR